MGCVRPASLVNCFHGVNLRSNSHSTARFRGGVGPAVTRRSGQGWSGSRGSRVAVEKEQMDWDGLRKRQETRPRSRPRASGEAGFLLVTTSGVVSVCGQMLTKWPWRPLEMWNVVAT